MRYKYSDDINKRLYKAVKNYNEKRERDIKHRGGRAIVPEKKYVKQIKERFADKPRSSIMKEIKLIESYNALGKSSLKRATSKSPLSNWEMEYFKARIPSAKKFYDEEINELERILKDKPEYFIKHHDRLNTLKAQRKSLDKVLSSLSESDIKSIRAYIKISQRSQITKENDYRLFLTQLDRAMELSGYSNADIKAMYDKLNTLTPNEFIELYRKEPIIEKIYELVGSPETQGEYELMTTENTAVARIDSFLNRLDSLIAEVKNHD